jgi:hypothetical protein
MRRRGEIEAMKEIERPRWLLILALVVSGLLAMPAIGAEPMELTVRVETPLAPPGWALLERELLRANARACEEFFSRYFDDRGYLECVERWGGDDGPDDAIDHPQPVQWQSRPFASQGDGRRLGGRPDRSGKPIQARARRKKLPADA